MIYTIQSSEIDDNWDIIKKHIKILLKKFDIGYNLVDIYEKLKNKELQVWISVDKKQDVQMVCLTNILIYPLFKTCEIFMVSGTKYKDWVSDILKHIENWAKENDCKYVELRGRLGWTRVLKDYYEPWAFLRKEI